MKSFTTIHSFYYTIVGRLFTLGTFHRLMSYIAYLTLFIVNESEGGVDAVLIVLPSVIASRLGGKNVCINVEAILLSMSTSVSLIFSLGMAADADAESGWR